MPALMLNGVNYSGAGGGGNANEQVLTWAEYCALTPEEKMNDTTYYINDINGDGQSFQPVIYSTDEREIGVWTDGKPLYEKTVNIGKITSTGEKTYTLGMQNVDTIVAYTILPLERSGDTGLYAVDNYNYSWGSGSYTAYTIKKDTTNGLQIIIYSGYYTSSNDIYVTIRYTKTTDTPGSGTWTPQGVPSVHYSTDEKVVGTWIDGSTVYEKTYVSTASDYLNHYVDATLTYNAVNIIGTPMAKVRTTGIYDTDYIGIGNPTSRLRTFSNDVGGFGYSIEGYISDFGTCTVTITVQYTKTAS